VVPSALSRDDDLVDPIWSKLNKKPIFGHKPLVLYKNQKWFQKMMKLALRVFCFAEISGARRWQMMIPNYNCSRRIIGTSMAP